ncbi:PA3496 family putative envelope integrity protein [Methylobacter sp. YRD-M1]|uniref:PA3496 family putative envelope integrity protein n=1 Tax=Methylobacter sp. YRD-M1 TaxID=2911520 RepID=UPI00227CC056|nr:hypothetical protein [Methylobacter sp. YRD-M1]WAK00712.1 hypothetical protein LZ558_12735 [Methylobacter sp. YRD-M1]
MSKTSSKSAVKTRSRNSADIEHEDEELFEDSEYASFSDGVEKETIKRDARRKIEIYWEKKRLKEQLDGLDESEFDESDLDF